LTNRLSNQENPHINGKMRDRFYRAPEIQYQICDDVGTDLENAKDAELFPASLRDSPPDLRSGASV
jgi:hypothetical protein